MNDLSAVQEYRPLLLTRRSELVSWIITGITLFGWLYFRQNIPALTNLMLVFFALALFTALGSSYGNWMDRSTVLRVSPDGLAYRNGLQNIQMPWQDIQEMHLLESRLGRKVHLIGSRRQFSFRMMSELQAFGRQREQTGFAKGEEIVDAILQFSGLSLKNDSGSGKYYART